MPSKRRRLAITNRRRRKKTQESYSHLIYLQTSDERNIQKIDSDIRTIPDHTFGKVYSTQIVSSSQITQEIPSLNVSSMIEPEIIAKSKKNKSIKKKENNRKR